MILQFLKYRNKKKCCSPLKPLTDPKSNILTGAWQLMSSLKGQMPCKDLLILASCYVHPLTTFKSNTKQKSILNKYKIPIIKYYHEGNGKLYEKYFANQLAMLKREYIEHLCVSDFYRYYRSGRTDRDSIYFKRGHINYHDGLNSIVFEIDPVFSTFYDYKTARIIANELLYSYLLTKISPDDNPDVVLQKPESSKDIFWTDSKNALIELIYALHAAASISHGKIGIRKISLMFQILFRIPLGDLHHAFHRMKTRTGSRTAFLDQLKASLEEYMDKDE